MPATTERAVKKKLDNRKSKKDIGRESKIRELGGIAIKVDYGKPLSDEERTSRLDYLYDLMYPKRKLTKASKRPVLSEEERRIRGRDKARERYQRQRELPSDSRLISHTPWYTLWVGAKTRAKKQGVPFSITPEDVFKLVRDVEVCPVLGLRFNYENKGGHKDNSPTLDKFIPELGYTKENTYLLSYRANSLKSNATLQEVGKLYCWMAKNSRSL